MIFIENMVCSTAYKIQDEELNHKPKYNSEYDNLREDEKESLNYTEEKSYLADPSAEDRFHDEHRTKHGNHLSECDDADCQRVRDNWKGDGELSKYIH